MAACSDVIQDTDVYSLRCSMHANVRQLFDGILDRIDASSRDKRLRKLKLCTVMLPWHPGKSQCQPTFVKFRTSTKQAAMHV